MLDVILRILPIVGVIFLTVLMVAVIFVLLALFYPVTYRIHGVRQTDIKADVKVRWLLGLVRARYQYPKPGRIIAKLLCFTLYDGGFPASKDEEEQKADSKAGKKSAKKEKRKRANVKSGDSGGGHKREKGEGDKADGPQDKESAVCKTSDGLAEGNADGAAENILEDKDSTGSVGSGNFFHKIEKLKYTIGSFCDKIKEIWENISYYIELLQEESTKELFAATFFKLGKILKCIRPRHIKADIVFGTGSPDTTGYLYGIYCMLTSFPKWDRVQVQPDFENAVLKGEVEISGRITLWVLLVNGLKLALDERLKTFGGRIKAGGKDSRRDLKKGSL